MSTKVEAKKPVRALFVAQKFHMAGCACLVLVLIACAVSLHERTGLRAVNNNDVALSRGAKLLSAPRANKVDMPSSSGTRKAWFSSSAEFSLFCR